MESEKTFSAEDAAAAASELRRAIGLEPQRFGTPQFVGMISDEIEQLRGAGRSDGEIAALLRDGCGVDVSAEAIGRYYASPQERGRPA